MAKAVADGPSDTLDSLAVRLPGLYVRGDLFAVVARAISLLLAFVARVLAFVFVFVLPATGRLTLGDGLTFVGFLLTAASFFAAAGRPDPVPVVVKPPQPGLDWNEMLGVVSRMIPPKDPPTVQEEPPEPEA